MPVAGANRGVVATGNGMTGRVVVAGVVLVAAHSWPFFPSPGHDVVREADKGLELGFQLDAGHKDVALVVNVQHEGVKEQLVEGLTGLVRALAVQLPGLGEQLQTSVEAALDVFVVGAGLGDQSLGREQLGLGLLLAWFEVLVRLWPQPSKRR